MAKWYKAQLSSSDPLTAEIAIYDDIGFYGITPMDFLKEIDGLGPVQNINLLIDSNGGAVDAALAMFNILKRHPAKVTAKIDAAACSAATLVACAADEVQMPENTVMFVHNPMAMMLGYYNSAELRDEAELTDKWRDLMIRTYASKTTMSPDDIGKMLDASTWLNAEEAVKAGLADKVLPVSKAVAHVNVARLPNVPAVLASRLATRPQKRPPPVNAGEKWAVGASRDLPTSKVEDWDGPAAAKRMLDDAAGDDGKIDAAKAKVGFLVYDAGADTLRGSYKLPIADIINGRKTVTAGAVRAAASRLPQTDIPDDVRSRAEDVLNAYKDKLDNDDGDDDSSDNNDDDQDEVMSIRAVEVAKLCKIAGMPELAPDLIIGDKSLDEIRDHLAEKRAEKDAKIGEVSSLRGGNVGGNGLSLDRAASEAFWAKAHERAKQVYGI